MENLFRFREKEMSRRSLAASGRALGLLSLRIAQIQGSARASCMGASNKRQETLP
jgi:hypothetical protein